MSTLNLFILACLMAFVVALVSYHAGKRFGTVQGLSKGRAEMPIKLRERALREGECPVCGSHDGTVVQCGKKG